MNGREKESYVIGRLINLAKAHECCILIIMHFTKGGSYKGSTEIVHAADALFTLEKNPDDYNLRDLICHKNRFGQCSFTTFPFGSKGYTFEAVESENPVQQGSKGKKTSKRDLVLEVLDTPKTIAQIANESQVSGAYLTNLLRELTNEDKVTKDGKGATATFVQKI